MTDRGYVQNKKFHFPVRVYYEDTDQQGIVFYANYLKYFERGRTELLRYFGCPPGLIEAKYDRVFVVVGLQCSYERPAVLDDLLDVQTELIKAGKVRFKLDQKILREEELIASAQISLAVVNKDGRPARMGADLEAIFTNLE